MSLRLCQIEQEDLPQLRDWRNSPEIRLYTREYRLLNMENQQDWFEWVSKDRSTEMFGIMADKWLVGVCGLTNINWVNRTAEISIYVGNPSYQGVGIGFEVLELLKQKAFEEFNLNKLWAEVYSSNTASLELFKKAGYKVEGILKKHVFKQGDYIDSHLFGLWRGNND